MREDLRFVEIRRPAVGMCDIQFENFWGSPVQEVQGCERSAPEAGVLRSLQFRLL